MTEITAGIPAKWKYKWWWKGIIPRRYPVAWIYEGTMAIQCLCPHCLYARGYNEPIIAGACDEKLVTCPTCKTKFIALVV